MTESPSQHLQNVLESRKIALYAGIDPSAASLHVGNLAVLMTLLHFHLHGHKVIPLVGFCPAVYLCPQ
jgi:tyrosyl-tRNA synthetase